MADVAAGVITDVATAPALPFDAAAVSAITVVVIVAAGIIFDVAELDAVVYQQESCRVSLPLRQPGAGSSCKL